MKFYLFFFFFFLFYYFFNGDRQHVFLRIKLTAKKYFSEADSPYNIAIFRIIFFFFVLVHFNFSREKIIWFSQLPPDLIFPPVGMKGFLTVIPITPDLVRRAAGLFTTFVFLAMAGCFARAASLLAAIFGIYVLGVAQCYGKVDYYHHLIWFMFLLSASRCSDVWSIDSIWKSYREGNKGRSPKIRPSVVYALPLRFIWLLIGEIYFFPGLWKLLTSGWPWAWSDNLKYQLYASWFTHGGGHPFFRLDQHPLLYKICGLGVILFELTFIFVIFFRAFRPWAVVSGILFHQINLLFLNIHFFVLQICYVSFINWAWLLAKIRRDKENPKSGHNQAIKQFSGNQRLVKFTGIALLLINAVFGFQGIMSGWPFACYPTFAGRLTEARINTITLEEVGKGGEVTGDLSVLKQHMGAYRLNGMIESILEVPDKDQRESQLKAFMTVMKKEGIDLSHYTSIRFYRITYSTKPGEFSDPAISKELLEEINI